MAGVSSSCAPQTKRDTAFCAELADTIGLYVGNPVTQMGYPIGKVTSVQPLDVIGPARPARALIEASCRSG